MSDRYQICANCVMDTSDVALTFDAAGLCSFCQRFDAVVRPNWFPNDEGKQRLTRLVEQIKAENRDREYDCIIGLSGGVDSSYAAYVARRSLGLRLLAVHVDGGWNSELAVRNIENIVKRLDIDLHTHVIDWEEMRDLQVAFLRSGVANQDVPQDHAFFAALYQFAVKNRIRWVLSGGNLATEWVLPESWGYNAMDLRHLKSIHGRFGSIPLKTYPTCTFLEYYVLYPYLRGMRVLRPLNFMPYTRSEALRTLEQELGYRYYGTKHGESRFTKFFQNYWLPTRFGYDKRRAHFSSLILSGQMTRAAALAELEKPIYVDANELAEDRQFIAKKLRLSEVELNGLLSMPLTDYQHYASNAWLFELKDRIRPMLLKWGFGAAQK